MGRKSISAIVGQGERDHATRSHLRSPGTGAARGSAEIRGGTGVGKIEILSMLKGIIASTAIAVFAPPASGGGSELIDYLKQDLSEIRENIDARDEAPEEVGYLSFRNNRESYQKKIDKMLDKALQAIFPETFKTWLRKIERIQNKIKKAESRRADLMIKRNGADRSEDTSMVENILGREYQRGSIEDIDQRIKEIDVEISQYKENQESIVDEFAEEIKVVHGIILNRSDAKKILYSVNGEIIVESIVVLSTLADIERQLANVIRGNVGADTKRTYAGIASIARLIHLRMLQNHLAAYDGDWLPRLSDRRSEITALLNQTKFKESQANDDNIRKSYANNAKIQEGIVRVIDRYGKMLRNRRQKILEKLPHAEAMADVAINTLITLDAAVGLSFIISESTGDYDDVMSIDLPELEMLNAEEIDRMLDISRELTS